MGEPRPRDAFLSITSLADRFAVPLWKPDVSLFHGIKQAGSPAEQKR
jgi:hypothetical protein